MHNAKNYFPPFCPCTATQPVWPQTRTSPTLFKVESKGRGKKKTVKKQVPVENLGFVKTSYPDLIKLH